MLPSIGPLDAVTLPVDSVGMESRLRAADTDVGSTVVAASVALAEVVGFDLSGVTAESFPVDFVQVVGLEHDRADNTSTEAACNVRLGSTEKEVGSRGLNSGSIALLGDGGAGTIAVVAD